MTGLLRQAAQFCDSLTGRAILMLTVGMTASSIVSLSVAEYMNVRDFEHARVENVIVSTRDMAERYTHEPARTAWLLQNKRMFGVHETPVTSPDPPFDRDVSHYMATRLAPGARPRAVSVPGLRCRTPNNPETRAGRLLETDLPDCWLVRFSDATGVEHRLYLDFTPYHIPSSPRFNLVFVLLIIATSALLSIIAARLTAGPLRRLTEAARAFSVTLNSPPIPEQGPNEVRLALATFNIMQNRIRDGFIDRTQMLASITHDLQTPMTRLRLRLEKVSDPVLKERLLADLAVMGTLVRSGLELAESSESREDVSLIDISSILSAQAEDAEEMGHAVRFVGLAGIRAHVRPNALIRCLENLVRNAIQYAGDAELSCRMAQGELLIEVRDHGKGIPEGALEDAMRPFRRLDNGIATRGTGIGLAIAKAQAQICGASFDLGNHPEGGLQATIRLPARLVEHPLP